MPVPLGNQSATMPSVLYLGGNGEFLVGDAAERRALVDPDRVVRRFKRRIGDETPLVIGDEAHHAHTLTARLISWVAEQVTQRQGSAPDETAVTHPAAWGPHKQELLLRALTEVGLPRVRLISEPAAAAFAYARSGRLPGAGTFAVYDLGGGTFDACVMRAEADGSFAVVGVPAGLPNLGGIDFDDAVLDHVLEGLGATSAHLDPADPMVITALARLRRECVDAKEALSTDTATCVPVLLGELSTSVRITRAEFEELIAPGIANSIDALESTLRSAGVEPSEVGHVLLTGGSSRIPLVVQALSARLGPAVRLDRDLDPKLAVAMGAALAALDARSDPAPSLPAARGAADPLPVVAGAPPRPDASIAPSPALTLEPPRRRTGRTLFFLAAAAVALVAGGLGQHFGNAGHHTAQQAPAVPNRSTVVPVPTVAPAAPVAPTAPVSPTTALAPVQPAGDAPATDRPHGYLASVPIPRRPPATAPTRAVVERRATAARVIEPATMHRPTNGATDPASTQPGAAAQPHLQPTQPIVPGQSPAQPAQLVQPAQPAPAAAPAPENNDSGTTEFNSAPAGAGAPAAR
jgi:hypothetical protein